MKDSIPVAFNMLNINNHLLDSTGQLIVVFNEHSTDHNAVMVVMEKTEKEWQVMLGPIPTGVGKNGFAEPSKKKEGDGKSPTGLFRLGRLFCYESNVETEMPFTQTTNEDKWIDDPESEDYNRHIRGETTAKSFEKLLLENDSYKYCMVIEYNTNPVVKEKGSAIFFHLGEEIPGSTSGCIAIDEKNMLWILKWLNPQMNPSILMGNKQVLLSGH